MTDFKVEFLIGAKRGPGFRRALRQVESDFLKVGKASSRISDKPTKELTKATAKLQNKTAKSNKTLKKQKGHLAKMERGQTKAGRAIRHLGRQSGQAERKLEGLNRAARRNQRVTRAQSKALRNQARHISRLSREYKKAEGRVRALRKRQLRARGRMGPMRGVRSGLGRTMAYGAGLSLGIASPLRTAIDTEMAEFRLGTVINYDKKGTKAQMVKAKKLAMADAKKQAKAMTREGITSLREGLDIQYALNSAGLSAGAARAGAPVIGKVAISTAGIPEEVGEVVATAYNNLGESIGGTKAQKFTRIGELLTQTQKQFQIRNFGQLGESMKYASEIMSRYDIDLVQGFGAVGQLSSAGLGGSMAGTGLRAMLRGLLKAQDVWGTEMVRNQKGQLDLIATLEQVRAETADMTKDERAKAFNKVFGEEGSAALEPLIKNLDALRENIKKVKKESKGVLARDFAEYSKTTKAHLKSTSGYLTTIMEGLGKSMLPGLNLGLQGIAGAAEAVGNLAQKHPTVTKGLGLAASGAIAFALGKKFFGRKKAGKGRRLFGWREGGLPEALGGAVSAGATPVLVTNWPGGGGGLDDLGGGKGRKKRGRAGRMKRAGRSLKRRGAGRIGRAARALKKSGGELLSSVRLPARVSGKGILKGSGKATAKGIGKAATKGIGKTTAKVLSKGLLKTGMKKIPFLAAGAGLFFGAQRAMAGDWKGALGEVASGILGNFFGLGTAGSVVIDTWLAARDVAKEMDQEGAPTAPRGAADPAPLVIPPGSIEPLTAQIKREGDRIEINIAQTNNVGEGATPADVESVLTRGEVRLKKLIEDTLDELWRHGGRTSFGTAGY